MRRGGRGIVMVLLLVLALPPSLAAPGQGALEFDPPAQAAGVGNVSVPSGTHLALYGILPDVLAEVRITGQDLRLTRTNTTQEFACAGARNCAEVPGTIQTRNDSLEIGSGRFDVVGALANLTLILSLEDEAEAWAPDVRVEAPLRDAFLSSRGGPSSPKTLEPFSPYTAEWPNRQPWVAPGLRHHLSADRILLNYTGRFSLLVSGADVHWSNATDDAADRTGSWRETAPGDPTGVTMGFRFRTHHVSLRGSMTGSLQLAYEGPFGHIVPASATLRDVHLLSVPITNGTFDVGGGAHDFRNGSFLDVRGRFDTELAAPRDGDVDSPRISAHVSGEISGIAENRAAAVSFDPAAVIVVGGAASLAILLSLTGWGRDFLTVVTGRNAARPLGHPLRVKLVDEIAKRPGITQSQLATKTGVGLWLARYHLRILRRGNVIDVVRSQTTDTFFLNGGSYRFYAPRAETAPGETEPQKILVAKALAELHHPIRRRIFETLHRIGPASYEEMSKAWTEEVAPDSTPTRPNVSYHAGLMERAGLLERKRRGREVVWSLTVDLYEVLDERVRRCLSDAEASRVYSFMRERPGMTLRQVESALLGGGSSMNRARLGDALHQLERAGLLVQDAANGAYTPTPAFAVSGDGNR